MTEVVEGDASIESKNGNKMTRKGGTSCPNSRILGHGGVLLNRADGCWGIDEDNPAVKIVNSKGSNIIKKASELEVEE